MRHAHYVIAVVLAALALRASGFGLNVTANYHGGPGIYNAGSLTGPLERSGEYTGPGWDVDPRRAWTMTIWAR